MNYVLVLLLSAVVSFYVHDFLDRKWIGRKKLNLRLIVKGYHFHHSFFGALVILGALLFTGGGFVTVICCGYGVGNIFQHKLTHNRVKEKGMVFVTKFMRHKRNIT
jgi:hypothetical protein